MSGLAVTAVNGCGSVTHGRGVRYTCRMIEVPSQSDAQTLREFFDSHAYSAELLTARLGQARPPNPEEAQRIFDQASEITVENLLVRLFLLGSAIDESITREFLPDSFTRICLAHGLLAAEDGRMRAQVVIVPVGDFLIASDAFHVLGTDRAATFVLPASTHSANFLRLLTMRTPVESAFDLGCGCGIQALFAARHADRVVATDTSESAIRYTQFNALLNAIDNIECRVGSLFEPVQDERFDLIVSNPPFVIAPGESFEYRDNALELDEFCRLLVREAPGHLNAGGHLQMLCEWVEVEGQAWSDRVTEWVRGCDAWILHSAPVAPRDYVQRRSSDISGESVSTGSIDEWTAYFDHHRVKAVHPGVITLRRRDGRNWLHVQNLSADVTEASGAAIIDGIAAVDFIESCDDESMLQAYLKLADTLGAAEMKQGSDSPGIYLRLDNGLSTDAEIDAAVAAFLNLFDGKRTVSRCIDEFASATDADRDSLAGDLLAILRVMISRGFLVPADID